MRCVGPPSWIARHTPLGYARRISAVLGARSFSSSTVEVLERISKTAQQDYRACEFEEAEKVLGLVLVAGDESA
jgi:hypothetical protein